MSLGTKFLFTMTLIILFFASAISPQDDPVKTYKDDFSNFLSTKDDTAFNSLFNDQNRLNQLTKGFTSENWNAETQANDIFSAYWLGNSLADSITANLDKEQRISAIVDYIKKLTTILSQDNFLPGNKQFFSSFCNGLKTIGENNEDRKKIQPILDKCLNEMADPKVNVDNAWIAQQFTEIGKLLTDKKSTVPVKGTLTDNELQKNEIAKFTIDEKKKLDDFINNFKFKKVWLFIAIGVLLLILAVLSVFLFLLFRFGKQLKVKKPLPHQKEVKIESENKSNFNAHVKQKKEEGEIISLKEVILELSTELRELMDTNDSKLNVAIESVLKPKIEKWEEEFNQRFTEHIENKLNDKFQINKRDTEQLNDKSMIYTFFQELRKFMSEKTDQSKGMPIVHDEKNQSEDQLVSNRQKLEEMWSAETFDSLRNHIDKLQVNIKNNSFFDRCYKLEQHLTFDKDLGSAYKNTLNPLREYDKKITKIMNIPKLISTDPGIQLKVPTLEKRIQMIKNSMDFLCSLEEPSIVTLILGFNIEKWVKEEFWDIADQFYRKYQMRIFKEKKASEMEEARTAIDQILAEFKLKVVPIEIGRTHFDSNLHNGTSNTKESVMSDLVISGIVHNGLQEISGVVLKQPEVIVNVL